jgi:hypothetical protein
MSRDLNNNNNGNKNLKYEKENIELRRDKVFELNSRGYSQHDIAKILNVSVGLVNSDLKYVYAKAKETFHTFIQEELPKEFKKAITTYDYVIRTASTTAETTHDDRIKLQALHEVREARAAKMDLISNHDVMTYQITKGKGKETKEEDSQSPDLEGSEQDYDSTEEDQEQEQENSTE